jgi:aminoglycoside phosphotransferase
MHEALPPELAAGPLGAYLAQIPHAKAVTIGESASPVYQLANEQGPISFLKVCPRSSGLTLADDAARLAWLADRLPVPRLLAYHEDATHTYLLMSAVPGIDAATLAETEQMATAQLVRLLAVGLRQIHAVPVVDCPFDHRLARELAQARLRAERGLVDEDNFDDERQGRAAASLLQELLATAPATEDLVLTHGDYCLPNIMIAEQQVSGFIDLGSAGVGDRYRDLALVRRSLIRNCGEEWVAPFFTAYGLPRPDEAKLAFYQLLDEFY